MWEESVKTCPRRGRNIVYTSGLELHLGCLIDSRRGTPRYALRRGAARVPLGGRAWTLPGFGPAVRRRSPSSARLGELRPLDVPWREPLRRAPATSRRPR